MNFFENNRGAAAVEFAIVALPVMFFILGIIQTSYVLWADNLLHFAVDTAARCGAVQSTTPPCNGTDMVTTATTMFGPLNSTNVFETSSGSCTSGGGVGVSATYTVNILYVVDLTLAANSCYPKV